MDRRQFMLDMMGLGVAGGSVMGLVNGLTPAEKTVVQTDSLPENRPSPIMPVVKSTAIGAAGGLGVMTAIALAAQADEAPSRGR